MKHITLFIVLLSITLTVNGKTGKQIIEENGFNKSVTPKLTTAWSQNGGENSLLPIIADNMQAVTGCGATALGQLLKYWKKPNPGTGYNYYYWQQVEVPEVLFADFQTYRNDWENMLCRYKGNQDVTAFQLTAVRWLTSEWRLR